MFNPVSGRLATTPLLNTAAPPRTKTARVAMLKPISQYYCDMRSSAISMPSAAAPK